MFRDVPQYSGMFHVPGSIDDPLIDGSSTETSDMLKEDSVCSKYCSEARI